MDDNIHVCLSGNMTSKDGDKIIRFEGVELIVSESTSIKDQSKHRNLKSTPKFVICRELGVCVSFFILSLFVLVSISFVSNHFLVDRWLPCRCLLSLIIQ